MNRLVAWLKSLSWIALAGGMIAAVLMVMNARRAGAMEVQIKHDEAKIDNLREGQTADAQAVVQLREEIKNKKIKARDIRKRSEAAMERIGEEETLADIAERFNGRRVRSREETAAPRPDGVGALRTMDL